MGSEKCYIRGEIYKKSENMCYILLSYGKSLLHLGKQLCCNQEPMTPRGTWGVDQEADTALVCLGTSFDVCCVAESPNANLFDRFIL